MTAFCSRRMRFCAAKRIIAYALNNRPHFYPEIDGRARSPQYNRTEASIRMDDRL
jgi:hypothetical protein